MKVYNSGFTLLGDQCQAIYDYQSENMSSKKFYEEIEANFKNVTKIKYCTQKRQCPELDKKATLLRAAIESKDDKIMQNLIIQILRNIQLKNIDNVEEGIILTRKNGTVYNISRNLNNIKHSILDNSRKISYPSWIGYLFGGYKNKTITKNEFKNLIIKNTEQEIVEKYWRFCKEIENIKDENSLDIVEMHKNIIVSDNTEIIELEEDKKTVISTVHKAKGKEFDKVYLDMEIREKRNEEDIIDYAKLLYVAITRAKNQCYEIQLDNSFYKKYYALMQGERYIEFIYKNLKNKIGKTDKSIRKIEIGLEGDIDNISFIDERIIGNAYDNIEYIRNSIKSGDEVDLLLEKDTYYIYHNKRKIGKMNIDNLYKEAQMTLNKVQQMTYKPLAYAKVRVRKISTIAMFQEFIPSEIQNIYAQTGMWIRIELEGFGELKWKNN